MPNNAIEHAVVSGETLSTIAELYYGDPILYKSLARYNSLANPDTIQPGDIIKIPPRARSIKSAKKNGNETHLTIVCKNRKAFGSDGMIFYAPGRNEFFEVEEADLDALIAEVDELNALQEEIAEFRRKFDGDSADSKEHVQKAQELEEKVKEKFQGVDVKASDAIQELLVITDNAKWGKYKRRVYIRPYQTKRGNVKGHWRTTKDTKIRDKIRRWYKSAPDDQKPQLEKKLKAVLWQSPKIDEHWPWEFKFRAEGQKNTAVGSFAGSAEAQFFRFSAGVAAESEFDLDEMKLKVGLEGNLSYNLAEGTASGRWTLPGEHGIDFFGLFDLHEKSADAIKKGRECRFRLSLLADSKAFVGAGVTASVALPAIDLKGNPPEGDNWKQRWKDPGGRSAYAGAGGDAFAGASVEGALSSAAEWSPSKLEKFDALALVKGSLSGRAGAGIGGKIEIGYKKGKLVFELGAQVVAGLGGKAGYAFEVAIDEGFDLVAHIFYSVDYHYVKEVLGEAFFAFRDYSFATFKESGVVIGNVATAAVEELQDFGGWLSKRMRMTKLLRETKHVIRGNIQDGKKLKNAPPETLGGQVLRTLMIEPEKDDFDAIIKVLESADSPHELKWIVRSIENYLQEDPNGNLLNDGLRELLNFGVGILDDTAQFDYRQKVEAILMKHGVVFYG